MNYSNLHLDKFSSLSLSELDQVALLDRMDTKFIFNIELLNNFLDRLSANYSILEIDGRRIFQYESLYFDTDKFALYNQHFCGRMNRYKIRFRNYVESNLSFFEIKFKNNKGRTIKSRLRQAPSQTIDGEAKDLLTDKTFFKPNDLKPLLWINYLRITLISKDLKERLTLDLDLTFKKDETEKKIERLVIAEVKQSKATNSFFNKLMKESNIRSGSISKYCFGVASMFGQVRKNNFKPQIMHLNKILYATSTGY
jgi:hypothetical protein